jgi:mRNA-degrading endonuclease toxin of MazEF toxin-antitoxin module
VLLPAKAAGLPKDSVANTSQVIAVDRAFLTERMTKLSPKHFAQVMSGIDVVLGR